MKIVDPVRASNPPLSERQTSILELIEAKGFVTLEMLADAFGVSMQTARRDVIAMDAAGLIERFHGGAGARSLPSLERLHHGEKQTIAVDEKRRIAARAAALPAEGATVYIDVGTTAEAVAAALNERQSLSVVTNSLHVAGILDPARHEVRVLPGRVAGPDGSICGEDTVLALATFRLDHAFIGCSAVEPGGAAMDFDLGKIAIKRTAMAVARASVLIATREKFGRTARAEIAMLNRFDVVMTGTPD